MRAEIQENGEMRAKWEVRGQPRRLRWEACAQMTAQDTVQHGLKQLGAAVAESAMEAEMEGPNGDGVLDGVKIYLCWRREDVVLEWEEIF